MQIDGPWRALPQACRTRTDIELILQENLLSLGATIELEE
jgi:hypothetical protein